MKCLNFVVIGLAASLMMGSCNSSTNPKEGENCESSRNTQTEVDSAFDKVVVSESGIGILNEEGILDNLNGKSIASGTNLRDILVVCSQRSYYPMSKDFADEAESTYGFYNRVEVKMASLAEAMPYILLYNDNELMVALEPTPPAYNSFDLFNSEVNTIVVYSDKLKMRNGIHAGMSAKEMVETYNAKIRYESGAETDFLSFDIEGFPSNVKLMGSFDSVNSHLEGDYEYLKLEDVKNGKLDAIVILPQWADSY